VHNIFLAIGVRIVVGEERYREESHIGAVTSAIYGDDFATTYCLEEGYQ